MFLKFNALTSSASQLLEKAEQMRRDSEKEIQGNEPDFAQRLKDATQRRLAARNRFTANAASASSGESFAEKVKRAAQRHPKSKEQTQKAAQKNRERYTFKPRPHSKGE
jgi:hypothetical protein